MENTNTPDNPDKPEILGHYQVLEQIGQGGMAVVYKGVQPSLNREVAIKVLPSQFSESEELIGRFEREANIAAKLNHPNIVQIIDRGKQDDTYFLVMEYVEGRGLDELIKERKMTIGQVVNYAMQICDGLEYAHSQGVIHRDLKPANILIDTHNCRAKIADFGIARLKTPVSGFSTLTTQNSSLGTINYMSPEQRTDSHSITQVSDIFSFGVVLYQMLTGRLPLGHFKLPSRIRKDIPMGFDPIVEKCLQPQPADRYQNVREIRAALGGITGWQVRYKDIAVRVGGSVRSMSDHTPSWLYRARYILTGVGIIVIMGSAYYFGRNRLIHGGPELNAPRRVTASILNPNVQIPAEKESLPAAPTMVKITEPDKAAEAEQPKEATPDPKVAAYRRLTSTIKKSLKSAGNIAKEGKFEEAIALYSSIVSDHKTHPLAAEAQFALARIYDRRSSVDSAIKEYSFLLRFYPEAPRCAEALLLLGKIHEKVQGSKDDGFAQSETYYKRLIDDYPKSSSAQEATVRLMDLKWRTGKKIGLLKNKHYKDIQIYLLEQLQDLITKYPKSSQVTPALVLIAEIAEKPNLEDWETAADALIRLQKREPDKGPDHLFKAIRLLGKSNNRDRELVALKSYVETYPEGEKIEAVRKRLTDLEQP